jgi:hypothetical protein
LRPRYEVAHLIQQHGQDFLQAYPQSAQVQRTLNAIANCRTSILGGHEDFCTSCGAVSYSYNSCRNRHCPKCQAVNRERWILQRENELLPIAYYHIVFTIPHELNSLAITNPKEVYRSIFQAAWGTIKSFSSDPKFLGAKTGMITVLHTWGQQLELHPHLHCIVPGGGLSQTGKWKQANGHGKYLFPQKAMAKVFRAKYLSAIRSTGLIVPQYIAGKLMSKDWVVYCKRPFIGPKSVIEYLGRYTHKIAISNHRLLDQDASKVHFSYKDYRNDAKQKVAVLSIIEFLRRFCLHVLPFGFVRIRHYGILASRNKATDLNMAKDHFNLKQWKKLTITWQEIAENHLNIPIGLCPHCNKGTLVTLRIINPQRGPPAWKLPEIMKQYVTANE